MRLIDADQFGVVSFQGKSEDFIEGALFILDKIYDAPTVERPHGEWLSFHYDFMGRKKIPHDKNLGSHTERNYKVYEYFMCSICGNRSIKYDFCPWCGASMEKEGGEK